MCPRGIHGRRSVGRPPRAGPAHGAFRPFPALGPAELAVDRPVPEVPDQRRQTEQHKEGDKGENHEEDVHAPTVVAPPGREQWQDCRQPSNYCQIRCTLEPC